MVDFYLRTHTVVELLSSISNFYFRQAFCENLIFPQDIDFQVWNKPALADRDGFFLWFEIFSEDSGNYLNLWFLVRFASKKVNKDGKVIIILWLNLSSIMVN